MEHDERIQATVLNRTSCRADDDIRNRDPHPGKVAVFVLEIRSAVAQCCSVRAASSTSGQHVAVIERSPPRQAVEGYYRRSLYTSMDDSCGGVVKPPATPAWRRGMRT
jgi:hypothetical protein